MAKQTINQGTAPTGAGGDTFRSGSAKLQANDDELYAHLGAPDGALTVPKTRTKLGIEADKSELTILIKDSLRQSVELASGGEQTVLYTAKGQPTYMNIIKKFDMSTIDPSLSGTHPAFVVNGKEKAEIFIGTYQGRIVDGELLSLPNVEPTASTNFENFLAAARASGAGHHLITNAEWSAIALQCFKDNKQPMGNTYYGRSSENPLLIGRRADGLNPGDTSGSARTLTGSGPVEWRHNGKENGIADLAGNVWEWSAGMRLVNGEIQIIADNNAALHTIDLSETSAQWKAIDGATGNLVTPDGNGTTAGTVKFANSGTADYTINGSSFGAIRNLSTTKPVSAAALARLKALCLYPVVEDAAKFNSDGIWKTIDAGERVPLRGGHWYNAASAGVFALNLASARSLAYPNIGARPAFVNL
ncbi:formylglycine-generating sulfatase enzyme family protein [Acinetobacter baumannii 348935]|nr:formylglycine-generating sulfatase enzyme family protein [Acinetobacter baumannii 348935]